MIYITAVIYADVAGVIINFGVRKVGMSANNVINVAIIGTAGRDYRQRPKAYNRDLWDKMFAHAASRFSPDKKYRLVSGGAAWADHLAVELFLTKPDQFELSLFLPAPLPPSKGEFEGDRGSAGSTSNWYHDIFKERTGIDGRKRIIEAMRCSATIEIEPKAPGMGAFFTRNAKVAKLANACLAYTWGDSKDQPADGGTLYTWRLIQGRKVHISLGSL